ncbi:MAG: NAD-dependent epimerase/dehydratase family protein [Acidimicrobiia bacterium]
MKVGVTGGSGVVGRALVHHLVGEGHEVSALARTPASAAALIALGASPIEGDVVDPPGLRPLVEGKEWVFHVAGNNEMCSRDPDQMDLVNIQGTRNVMEACRSGGVGRMIHTSSAAVIGESQGTLGTEDTRHRGSYLSRYERSKHLSEQLLFEEAGDLDVVAVNPSSVQGPGRATGTGKLILDLLNGRLSFLVETKVSIVDIADCARGHLLAAERGFAGKRYILNGSSTSISKLVDLFIEVTGRDLVPRFLPGWVVSLGATPIELAAWVTKRRAPICREMVRVLRAGHTYDGSRATRELGLDYTPLETTISRTVDWFREEGLLI